MSRTPRLRPFGWLLGLLPLALLIQDTGAAESAIRDNAGLFSEQVVSRATSTLQRTERETGIPTAIKAVPTLGGESIQDASLRMARQWGGHGLFVLIAKREGKLWIRDYQSFLGQQGIDDIAAAFDGPFSKRDFDAGLTAGADEIGRVLARATPPSQARQARRANVPAAPAPRVPQKKSHWGLGGVLAIVLLLVVGFFVIRLIGGLFRSGNRGYAGGSPMGGPAYGRGYGGGGGGGFWSSLFGGFGGAMAGNWMYDQMSHRDHGSTPPPTSAEPPVSDGGDWGGGGGGDWGGGGGGDWGGGGGDFGGGGGFGGGGDGGGAGNW